MFKRYTFWLWTAVVFQLLTAVVHSLTLFFTPEPNNETERQLMQLMTTYRPDLDPVFHPTMDNLVTALSACFSFLCLFAALINGYLLRKKAAPDLLHGIIFINVLVFGACFTVMAVFTFLPPIILTGLIFVNLVLSYLFLHLHTRAGSPE